MSLPPRTQPEDAGVYRTVVGDLPQPGEVPQAHWQPYETITPTREGFVDRSGVKTWYAVWGAHGPWIAFAPIFQITHSQVLKTTVPYLSRHFRVITMDLRGNGRSDRPSGANHYRFEEYYADFVAVLDATAGSDPVACIALSVTTMTAIRLAAEHPHRVSHLIIVGGFASFRMDDPAIAEVQKAEAQLLHENWPAYLAKFFSMCFPEPHSTKPLEDSILYAWSTTPRGPRVHHQRLARYGCRGAGAQGPLSHAGHPRRRGRSRTYPGGSGDPSAHRRFKNAHHRWRRSPAVGPRSRHLQPLGSRFCRRLPRAPLPGRAA